MSGGSAFMSVTADYRLSLNVKIKKMCKVILWIKFGLIFTFFFK